MKWKGKQQKCLEYKNDSTRNLINKNSQVTRMQALRNLYIPVILKNGWFHSPQIDMSHTNNDK